MYNTCVGNLLRVGSSNKKSGRQLLRTRGEEEWGERGEWGGVGRGGEARLKYLVKCARNDNDVLYRILRIFVIFRVYFVRREGTL